MTGSALHLSSILLGSILGLSTPLQLSPTASPTPSVQKRRSLEQEQEAFPRAKDLDQRKTEGSAIKQYEEWVEKSRNPRRREDRNLLEQTILEEDDDSESVT